ncbi:MAG TPA: hypothetical protein VGG22_01725 [Candidatus Baltobacteraceae bacterium]|jgi:hypothetical protein
MDARKATAAVSAAGMILIAGCGGGGKMGGGSLPSTGNGLHNTTAPANSSKIGLKFTLPPRNANVWTTPAYQPAYKQRRSKAFTPKRNSTSLRRKPQYINYGLIGGSITIAVYQTQNGTAQLALTQGPFTAGTTYGAYDFYCAYVPAAGTYQCANYSNVFAPLGNDTFYVVTSNSAGQPLSVTPGWPGTNYVAATQPSYTITSSGYPTPISIQTYAVASYLGIDAPTSCIDPSSTPLVAEAFLADASGYPVAGYLANPVTINMTGNFALYNLYAQPLATPYTAGYAAGFFNGFEFVASASGSAGVVSVSSTAGSVGINLTPSTSRNLYAVDRLALSPSTSGISVTGLVDSGPATYACGTLPMGNYATGSPVTSFSNPVAIGEDDYAPGAAVLDSVSGTPYLTVIDLNRFDFGDFLSTGGIVNAVPVLPIQVGGHNPLTLAVSPSEGVGSGMIYILNADGSIQTVNDNTFSSITTAQLESAGTITGPSDLVVSWNTGGGGDYVFATSNNSQNIFEISDANSDPSFTTIDLEDGPSISGQSLFTPVTYAASAENISGEQYVSFLAFDAGNGNSQNILTCLYLFCGVEMGNTVFSYSANLAPGQASFAYPGGSLYLLAANSNAVQPFIANVPAQPTSAPLPSFSNPVTQIIASYDGAWNGASTGGLVQFFYDLGGTVAGSMSGVRATIVSPFTAY